MAEKAIGKEKAKRSEKLKESAKKRIKKTGEKFKKKVKAKGGAVRVKKADEKGEVEAKKVVKKKVEKVVKPKEKAEKAEPKKKAEKVVKPKKEEKVEKAEPKKKVEKAKPKKEEKEVKPKEAEEELAEEGVGEEEIEEKVEEKKPVVREKEIEKIEHFGKKGLTGEERRMFSEAYHQKKKKPRFARDSMSKAKRLNDAWRRPRGIDSKQHLEKRGKLKGPKIGYKKPLPVSGKHPSGYHGILVHNARELEGLNPKDEAAVISKSVGRKKRNDLIKIANEHRIVILNPRKGEFREKEVGVEKVLANKKILMVIAPKDFRDEEFFNPKKIFEDNGADVTAASLSTQPAEGMMGAKVKPDIAIEDVDTKDYDAVVLVGGAGAQKHLWDNEKVQDICKTAYDAKKIVGAICLAPVVLARAGLLKKKDATVFDSKDAIKELKANNANYIKKRTVISENIITGNGPAAAKDFGAKIVKMLVK